MACVNLVYYTLGVGLFALSYAYAHVGYVGSLSLSLSAALAIQLLLRAYIALSVVVLG